MEIFVQFEDAKALKVVSVFGNPQDPDVYPHQGVVDDEDPRYRAFMASLPLILRSS